LHLVVNGQGEILSFCVTPGNVDDRKPVPERVKSLVGTIRELKDSILFRFSVRQPRIFR
jgi:hypothetical protein